MFKFISTYRLPISIIITLIGLFLFIFQTHRKDGSSNFQKVVQTLTYPMQVSMQAVVSKSKDLLDSYIFLVGVQEENKRLKQELLDKEEKLNQYVESSVQFRRLRKQLLFAQKNPDQKIFAEIIGESADNVHEVRLINRGSGHKVKRNYAVLRKEGLVGRVQSVTPFQSTVQLVIDHRNRVPALIQRNRVRGLVFGTHEGLEMRQISRRAEIKPGDRVISSGLGGLYPKGILIGWVTEVHHQKHELFKTAKLESAVDFNRIEEVFIIVPSKTDSRLFVE